MLASRIRSQLLVVDMQEKLLPTIDGAQKILENAIRLVGFARRLGIPITVTEHYPSGLGPTAGVLIEALGGAGEINPKLSFSAWRDEPLRARFRELRQAGRDQVVIVGAETHVCVCQTALDLIANDFQVFAVADAMSSRQQEDCHLAIQRLGQCGAAIVSQQMVAFEWLERAGTTEFKDLLPLLKS